MGVSKVLYGNDTVIDLTQDTVTAERLQSGYTAHGANGEVITGTGLIYTESADITPVEFDYNCGYVGLSTSYAVSLMYFTQEIPTQCYCDVYEIESGKNYSLSLDSIVGTRFRAGLARSYTDFTEKVNDKPSIKLCQVFYLTGSPVANQKAFFSNNLGTANYPYLIVQKDNAGKTGLITHLRELIL